MTYHINYNFVWRYFDKFYWGLLLSLELAADLDSDRRRSSV